MIKILFLRGKGLFSMKENYLVNTIDSEDFNIAGTYFLDYNLLKNRDVNGEELLEYIFSIIEAVAIKTYIDDISDESGRYLKIKNQEVRWLAAKTRFRAKSNLIL